MKLSDFVVPATEWNRNIWSAGHFYSGREPSRWMYDPRYCNRIHAGVDWAARWGSPAVAPADGTVTFAGWMNSGIGHACITRHDAVLIDQPGPFFERTVTVYHRAGHMAPDSRLGRSRMLVKVGDRVARGQPLGQVGNSGASAGPHVHGSLTVGKPEFVHTGTDLHLDPEQAMTGSTPGYYHKWQGEDDMAMVEDIQRNLNAGGFTDDAGRRLVVDGNWGARTGQAHAEMCEAAAGGSGGGGVLEPFDATITPK